MRVRATASLVSCAVSLTGGCSGPTTHFAHHHGAATAPVRTNEPGSLTRTPPTSTSPRTASPAKISPTSRSTSRPTPTPKPAPTHTGHNKGDCGFNHAWDGSTTTWNAPTTPDDLFEIHGNAIEFHFYLRCAQPGIGIAWTARSQCMPYGKGHLVASQQGTATLGITFYPGREYDCLTASGQTRSDIYLDGMQFDVDFTPAHNFDNSSGISYGDEGVIEKSAPPPDTWAR